MPRVSIIIPAYNAGRYLAQTLDSVMDQTFHDWECIVVNDGSKDDTAGIAAMYCGRDARFRLMERENGGIAAARNTAVAAAKGEFLLPLDADDLIAPSYIEKAVAVFDARPDVRLVYCRARFFGAVEKEWPLPEYSYDRLVHTNCIFCTSLFRRADAEAAGLYDESFRNGYEDWDFLLRFLKKDSVTVRIDEELFFYRQHAGTSSLTECKRNEKPVLERIARKYPEIYGPYRENIIHDIRKRKGREERMARRRAGFLSGLRTVLSFFRRK